MVKPSLSLSPPRTEIRKNRGLLPFARPDMGSAEREAVLRVLDSGWLTSGPEVERFELEFAEAVGAKKALALNSCTAAMHLTAVAWGLGKEDAVLLPTLSFTATAEIFGYSGCLPLLLDVDRDSYLFSPEIVKEFIEKECHWKNKSLVHRATQRRIRALVPVHLGGRPCDMGALRSIALKYDLRILDDAAHAFPAAYEGKQVGNLADVSAFSFYATKNLSTGEGGMLTTNDLKLAEKVRDMRLHGIRGQSYERKGWRYDVVCEGYKYNMMDICAALGRVQLKRSGEMLEKRKRIHEFYEKELSPLSFLRVNPVSKYKSAYHLYTIELEDEFPLSRDHFIEKMRLYKIALSLHFIPLYRFTYYHKKYGFDPKNYPNTEMIYKGLLSLPLYSAMSLSDAQDVIRAIQDIART